MRQYLVASLIIGLMFGLFIIVADSQGIVIDTFIDNSGISTWEYVFLTYMLFYMGGLILNATKGKPDAFWDGITVLVSIFILQTMGGLSVGHDIGAIFTSALTEFYDWGGYLAGAYALYLVYIFTNR